MLIDIKNTPKEIDLFYDIDKSNLENTDLVNISEIHVTGTIKELSEYIFNINLLVTGVFTLECVRSLEEEKVEFSIKIEENIEKNDRNLTNTLDIFPIVWENIVLEIPFRVVKKDATYKKEGKGWKFITDDE